MDPRAVQFLEANSPRSSPERRRANFETGAALGNAARRRPARDDSLQTVDMGSPDGGGGGGGYWAQVRSRAELGVEAARASLQENGACFQCLSAGRE